MTKQDPWFFEERAVAFASLALTKHNSVKVEPYAGRDSALDLRVEILKDGKPTMRFFGVQLVPSMELPDDHNMNGRGLSHPERDPFEGSIPVCVFVIGVRKPEGIYRWAVEPVIEDGQALLRQHADGKWHALDEAGAARLIDRVNAWYDARDGAPAPKARGRHAKSES